MNTTIRRWARCSKIPLDQTGLPDPQVCEIEGIVLTEYGLPARLSGSGPARPCTFCGSMSELPTEAELHYRGRLTDLIICDDCTYRAWVEDPTLLDEGQLVIPVSHNLRHHPLLLARIHKPLDPMTNQEGRR